MARVALIVVQLDGDLAVAAHGLADGKAIHPRQAQIFDRVYDLASLTSAPLTNVQTISVPPGGAAMVEFKLDVPGRYILVDHALSRLEKGLVGFLFAEGPEAPEIFHEGGIDE